MEASRKVQQCCPCAACTDLSVCAAARLVLLRLLLLVLPLVVVVLLLVLPLLPRPLLLQQLLLLPPWQKRLRQSLALVCGAACAEGPGAVDTSRDGAKHDALTSRSERTGSRAWGQRCQIRAYHCIQHTRTRPAMPAASPDAIFCCWPGCVLCAGAQHACALHTHLGQQRAALCQVLITG